MSSEVHPLLLKSDVFRFQIVNELVELVGLGEVFNQGVSLPRILEGERFDLLVFQGDHINAAAAHESRPEKAKDDGSLPAAPSRKLHSTLLLVERIAESDRPMNGSGLAKRVAGQKNP